MCYLSLSERELLTQVRLAILGFKSEELRFHRKTQVKKESGTDFIFLSKLSLANLRDNPPPETFNYIQ